ncbi:MAG: hypothetical protein OXE76_10650 [Alphaproteobacteria bacterium]|nr:hypothetical protein [Alphaproteobacteria bacterium]
MRTAIFVFTLTAVSILAAAPAYSRIASDLTAVNLSVDFLSSLPNRRPAQTVRAENLRPLSTILRVNLSQARTFAAHALALRTAGVAGEDRAAAVLAAMPGAGIVDREMLPALWEPFFANAIVQLGRLESPGPVALYYDPLLDIAVLSFWEKADQNYRVTSVRALPGAMLAAPRAPPPEASWPSWISARTGAIETLARITRSRLDAFRRAHPPDSSEAGSDDASFAGAAADMRAVLPRLIRNAAHHAELTGEAQPWLRPVLIRIEKLLAARDPAALKTEAPETDNETAEALAAMPPGFAEEIVLDMVIEGANEDRLLIGSSVGDGDVYVLVLCRIAADMCRLRRVMLTSLLD